MSELNSSAVGPGLFYDVQTDDGAATVLFVGDIDLASTPGIEERIGQILQANDVHTVRLDLGAVDFMDSTGLRMLWTVRQMAQDAQAKLLIRQPSDAVMRLLRLTGMHRIFQIEATD